jgi:iron complex outermembrane receptor protein
MESKRQKLLVWAVVFFLAAFFVSINASLHAQTKQLLAWSNDLNYLQNASSDELTEQKTAVVQIRTGVEFWIKMHPDSKIELKEAPPQPWGVEEIRNQVSSLRAAVQAMLAEDRPFNLGVTEVSVTAEASPLSPVADTLERSEIVNQEDVNVASALDALPGVELDHATNNRNESLIRIRGFSTRGQVSFNVDGIPVSMPYDGRIDFSRFLTSDLSEIQVAKGYSSPLLGPNALGGSINLVSKQPEKKLDADALIGTGSGDMLLSSLHLGSRWQHFYLQGSVDWLQQDFMPISGNFPLNSFQPTYERNQSDFRDEKYSGRFAWTPRGQDQYVFSYTNQKGEKGVPLYAGSNSAATFSSTAYRKWPYWNKDSYYFNSNTALGEASSIKFRLFYDHFKNDFDFYDDATYTTMKKSNSEHSIYDDHADGASMEFTNRSIRRNMFSGSFFFKDDIHKEIDIYPGRSPYPLTSPTLYDREQLVSIGFQDVITISSRARATFGFSADHLKGMQAEVFNSAMTATQALVCASSPSNTSVAGCTAHVWNYNPQASVSYTLSKKDTLFVTFADRGRFPLLMDSYSYKLQSAIPNPDLEPEHSRNWDIGYSHAFGLKTVAQIEYFNENLRNAIESVTIVDPAHLCPGNTLAGYCSKNVNIGKEVHQGMEFSIRTTPINRLTLDVNYSYLNRNLNYDFAGNVNVSQINTSISILPTGIPKNKLLANATLRLPREILALASVRYEGGITLQDTYYKTAPGNLMYGAAYGTMDLGTVVPIYAGMSLQAGVKNLFDRNYYYTPGFPEPGRNWYFNFRYRF